jgi:hypothetical protein
MRRLLCLVLVAAMAGCGSSAGGASAGGGGSENARADVCDALRDAKRLVSQLDARQQEADDDWPTIQQAYADLASPLAAAYDKAALAVDDGDFDEDEDPGSVVLDLGLLSLEIEDTSETIQRVDSFVDFAMEEQVYDYDDREQARTDVDYFANAECRFMVHV